MYTASIQLQHNDKVSPPQGKHLTAQLAQVLVVQLCVRFFPKVRGLAEYYPKKFNFNANFKKRILKIMFLKILIINICYISKITDNAIKE